MCRVTEKMQDFDASKEGYEVHDTSHNIQLVASVSFDQSKKQFDTTKFT